MAKNGLAKIGLAKVGHYPQLRREAGRVARSPTGTEDCQLRKAAGRPEGARAASGVGARGVPVLRGPSLDMPSLSSSGDGIDKATLSFLVKAAEVAQAEEEKGE